MKLYHWRRIDSLYHDQNRCVVGGPLCQDEILNLVNDVLIKEHSLSPNFNDVVDEMDLDDSVENEERRTFPPLKEKSLKKLKLSIENNLYHYKLSQNTFLPVGFQMAEEILGFLDVEDLISTSIQ